ncbi:MAG: hypothetical protein HY077_12235 [Elusimicrobia bacterium]|nr:hypothetical protein [Elusimicrobiota bacterium]
MSHRGSHMGKPMQVPTKKKANWRASRPAATASKPSLPTWLEMLDSAPGGK